MNRSDGRFRIFVVLCMLVAMALAVVTTGRAQETTADIEVYVKDAQGGAVPLNFRPGNTRSPSSLRTSGLTRKRISHCRWESAPPLTLSSRSAQLPRLSR